MSESSTTTEADRRREAQDELILAALVSGSDYGAAAELAGSSTRTVRRRMADTAFAAEVSRRRGERVSSLVGQLLETSQTAIDVMRDCLESPSEVVRLRAAQVSLVWAARLRGSHELERRLSAVEATVAGDVVPGAVAIDADSGGPQP